MAYEELSNVRIVALGGIDKKTGKQNPTQVEGYLVEIKTGLPNRFNPDKPQNLYVFQTSAGEVGVFGKAGIDSVMKNARVGAMTKLISTGETRDVGKGFPMKVFKAMQDKSNLLNDVVFNPPTAAADTYEDEGEPDAFDEPEEVVLPPSRAPIKAAQVDAARAANIQARMNAKKTN